MFLCNQEISLDQAAVFISDFIDRPSDKECVVCVRGARSDGYAVDVAGTYQEETIYATL